MAGLCVWGLCGGVGVFRDGAVFEAGYWVYGLFGGVGLLCEFVEVFEGVVLDGELLGVWALSFTGDGMCVGRWLSFGFVDMCSGRWQITYWKVLWY